MEEAKKNKRKNKPFINPNWLVRWFAENDGNVRRITMVLNDHVSREGYECTFEDADTRLLYGRLNKKLKENGVLPLKLKSSKTDMAALIQEWTLKNVLVHESKQAGSTNVKPASTSKK